MAKNGWIKLHRQILDSDIFYWKPLGWLKIWIYILLKINHSNSKQFPRGTGYFNWSEDRHELKKITRDQWYHCIKWLKQAKQITTQKTTRGIIIEVHNYEQYQSTEKQKSEAESGTKSEAKAKQKRSKGDTILEECKKKKNERTKILSQITNLKLQFPEEIRPLVMEYIEIAKNQNKTGKMGLNREKRLVNELLTEWMATETDDILQNDFKEALRITVENEAPHINYLKKVKKDLPRKRKVKLKKGYKKWR